MRYDKQIMLPEIGARGQKLLSQKSVAIVGLGGLGSNCANLLARAGIGRLILIDKDIVELSNLQRQTLYSERSIGTKKAVAAALAIRRINRDVLVEPHTAELGSKNTLFLAADVVLDCTDNLATRGLINGFCRAHAIPWVHASCIETVGRVWSVLPGGACYSCVYGKRGQAQPNSALGVMNTTVTITASLQVNEALKLLLGKTPTRGMITFDVWNPRLRIIKVTRDPGCPVCSRRKGGKKR